MGFLDKLEKTWTSWGVAKSFDLLGDAWGKTTDSMKVYASGVKALWHGVIGDDQFANAFGEFQRQNTAGSKGLLGATGDAVSGISELPVAKQIVGTADWAQGELVKRPLGTAYLAYGDMNHNKKSVWDADTWKQAYNDTRYVSTGQAAIYAGTSNPGADSNNLDPRSEAAQKAFHNDPWLKYSSGAIDTMLDVFADPTVVAGKGAAAAKLRFLSKPVKTVADANKFVDSSKYLKLHDYIKNAGSAEEVRQRVFAAHSGGDKAAALLYSVKDHDDLYDATFNALLGDLDSWKYLTQNAERIASVTGRQYANNTIATAANFAGRSDSADAVVNSLRETESQAFADSIANGIGAWAAASPGKAVLVGQNAPRLTLTSKWRQGVHQWVTYGPATFRGSPLYPVMSRARYALPTAKFTRFMDVNDVNSVSAFRANLERAPYSRQQVEQFVSQYGRASSPEARARVAANAEDAGFRVLAQKHGFTSEQVEKVVPAINTWRNGNRKVFQSGRRFMSEDVRGLAQKYIDVGRLNESDNAHFLADDIDKAVARGDQPAGHLHMLDEDGNNVLIPLAFDVNVAKPALLSQNADVVAMVDWRVLDSALWWARKGPLGKKSYNMLNAQATLMDTANTTWKVTSLLRAGYTPRMLSDDVLRRATLYGAGRVMMSTSKGVVNSARNWAGRYGLVKDFVAAKRRGQGLNAADNVSGQVVASSPTLSVLRDSAGDPVGTSWAPGAGKAAAGGPMAPVAVPLSYSSYERALADGVLSVPDYLRAIEDHAARGDLHPEVAMLRQGFKDGTLAPKAELSRTYQRHVVDRGLRAVGRGTYSDPQWQQQFLDHVIYAKKSKAQGAPGQAVVVDPLTGASPKRVKATDFTLSKGVTLPPHPDSVYDYVADNIDELLMPDRLMHAYVTPDGRLRLAVAKADGIPTAPIKETGGTRLKLLKAQGGPKRMSAADQVVVNTPGGQIRFAAAFEGATGQRFMAQASSRGPAEAWADQMANTEHARLMNQSGAHKDVSPDEPHYDETWARAVNRQIANDAAARMFLSGKTVDDVLNWMRNTTEGRAYWGRLGPWQSRPVEQIHTVKAMVDTYVPDMGTEASARLREKALAREAPAGLFRKLFDDESQMPNVHGASLDVALGGPFTSLVKKNVDRIFKVMSDIPADTASRFPFFAERYTDHLRDLAPMWAERYQEAGKFMTPKALDHIQNEARSRALADVKKYLYDTSAAMDMASAGKLLVPFSSAIGDSFLKWGIITREKGVIPPIVNIFKIWNAPDKAGLVQDQDGNVKRWENHEYVWYSRNPKTGAMERLKDHEPGQEYIVFQLPSAVAPTTASGAKMPTVINKEVFNTFLGLPTAGPLVTFPANQFELRHPEAAENRFLKTFVLPFGPSADKWKSLVPSNVANTWGFVSDDESNYRGLSQSVMQTEYTRFALGLRDKPPTMAEIHDTAEGLYGLQRWSKWFGVSSQFKSPYQPYIDYYHQLQAKDPEHATAQFYAEMGDEFRMMTASVSRNMAGLPASIESAKAQKKYADLVAAFPELAPLIVGAEGAGAFSSAVYQNQLEQSLQPGSDQKMRKVLSLQDSAQDAERRFVWVKYQALMKSIKADMEQRGLTSLNQKRAADLKKAKDQFVEQHKYWTNPQGVKDVHPWFEEYSTTDRAKMTKRLTGMAQLATDDRIGGRDDIQGLYDYLRNRTLVRQQMENAGYATLDTKKATRLRQQWESYVSGLTSNNTAFEDLYNRWLSTDDLTADIA